LILNRIAVADAAESFLLESLVRRV